LEQARGAARMVRGVGSASIGVDVVVVGAGVGVDVGVAHFAHARVSAQGMLCRIWNLGSPANWIWAPKAFTNSSMTAMPSPCCTTDPVTTADGSVLSTYSRSASPRPKTLP